MGGIASIPLSVLDAKPTDGDVHYGYRLDGSDIPQFVCALGGRHFVIPVAELERYRKTAGPVVVVDPETLEDRIE